MGYVYAISDGAGAVKIGWSAKPERRLLELNVAYPERFHLVGVARGTKKDESEAHSLLRAHQIRGEWFRIEGPVRDFLKMLGPLPQSVKIPKKRKPRRIPSHDTPIARYLADQKMTDAEFANLVGRNRTTVLRWRQGKIYPSFAMAAVIQRVTGGAVKVSDFIPKGRA